MGRVIWSDLSIEDLEDIFNFYKNKSFTAAVKMVEGIEQTGNNLHSDFLHQQEHRLPQGFRYAVYRYYKIIYEVVGTDIHIVRVFDTRQDPEKLK